MIIIIDKYTRKMCIIYDIIQVYNINCNVIQINELTLISTNNCNIILYLFNIKC